MENFSKAKEISLRQIAFRYLLKVINRTPTIEVATSNFYLEQGEVPTQYVELTQNVSKVGVIHHCGAKAKGKCKFSSSTRKVVHSTTTLNGGHFFLLTRPMSYPPRRS